MGWCWVFLSRKYSLTRLKSVVIPLLEYCCHLWNPWKAKDIYISSWNYSRTYVYIQNHWSTALNNWERLHEHKLCSLQKRRERYIIMYFWKITQHMVPNIDDTMGHKIKTRKHPWHRTQYVIQYPTNRNPAQSLQKNAITVFVPRLNNSLPKYLRDIESVKTEKFKLELEKFQELIPDEPKIPNYVTASGSNGILDQLTHLRAQGI